MNTPRPDINVLIACGTRLARLLSVAPASTQALRDKLEEILFERKNYKCFEEGIITREEVRNLVLAHLQTLICHSAGVEEPTVQWIDAELCSDVENAICGIQKK